ncbi:MAG: histidine phosphatase family protein [Actinomycetota bacterium]
MSHPVYLVRHGQSEWNLARLTQGQTAHPRLTDLGRRQAAEAAETIASDAARLGLGVGRLVTSDLTRAVETADIIAARLGATPTYDARLREQHLGALQGRRYEETWAAAGTLDWSDPTQPVCGGESPMDVYERMGAVLDGLDRSAVTVLVSHGDSIRAAVAHLNGVKPDEADWVDVPNGAVARVHDAVTWLGECPA